MDADTRNKQLINEVLKGEEFAVQNTKAILNEEEAVLRNDANRIILYHLISLKKEVRALSKQILLGFRVSKSGNPAKPVDVETVIPELNETPAKEEPPEEKPKVKGKTPKKKK